MKDQAARSVPVATGTTYLGEHVSIGVPKEQRIRECHGNKATARATAAETKIGAGTIVGNFACIYEGTVIGPDVFIEDHVRVGYDCVIGSGVRLMYGAYVCDRVVIEANARIAGFICDTAKVGPRATIMGSLVHEYTRPNMGWYDGPDEPAPIVGEDSVIGYHATVVGGVTIGPKCYVAAGATVTKDVPAGSVVTGINQIMPIREWPGKRLRRLGHEWGVLQ